MNSEYKLTLKGKTIDDVESGARDVLKDTKNALGFVPNMYAAMANSPILLNTYASGYRVFREQSGFSAIEQEVIFLTISRENECAYCMAAHSFVADVMSKVPTDITDAIRYDKVVPNEKLSELAVFTRIMVKTRGLPSASDVTRFIDAGYAEVRVLEIIQAISIKTISNYANHLFHTELDDVFSARQWSGA